VSRTRAIERLLWALGILLLAVWGIAKLHAYFGSRHDLARFEEARKAAAAAAAAKPAPPPPAAPAPAPPASSLPPAPVPTLREARPPDYALWSKERVKAYEESLAQGASLPLGILRIPKIGLEVAVLDGTDDLTLNRGVGHIEDTAKPGETGNVGIAGHRDGFFRGLKDIAKGDTMEIETLAGTDTYRITGIWIVKPEDVQVLDPTPEPSVTLVACYPFYFVGHAPQRYIVRGVRESRVSATRVAAAAP
jgi:sortase A